MTQQTAMLDKTMLLNALNAMRGGDFSVRLPQDWGGLDGRIADAFNEIAMINQGLAKGIEEVSVIVGTEGKLGQRMAFGKLDGAWGMEVNAINSLIDNLVQPVRDAGRVIGAVARGVLTQSMELEVEGRPLKGEFLKNARTINTMLDQLNSFSGEVTRVAREVGTEGKLGGQAEVKGASGVWKDLTENVNLMANNLTGQVRNIAEVTTAVAKGDLSRKITVDVRGEILQLKDTINIMVDQLNSFAGEVTRVAREVGTEGKLGGQADVKGVSGVWKDLTDSVNLMANNLTDQVRGIAKVVTGVAVGNLKQKMMVPAKGEVASLAETINDMVDTLATFSDQVTRVAREVGVEGLLGGQAVVPGAAGSWKDLVDNVNELAANLTTQVRAIGEVATAVTKGDLTRSIQVVARGEVALLKDNINQMIFNLKQTTERNTEQDWLKTNLARLTRMLQGQRDVITVSRMLLSELAPLVASQHAVLYLMHSDGQVPNARMRLKLMASYGYKARKNLSAEWEIGEGLVGQAAFEKERIMITDVPEDYVQIVSGLGQAAPRNIVVLPILFESQVKAVIELAAFGHFQVIHLNFLDQLAEGLGIVFNAIEAASSTEMLLQQSQSLASELKARQDDLQKTNVELEQKALQLSEQNAEVGRKNREIEIARSNLQEKAEQLALTSKYKSEFLANMSHELRTPLNSLLLLAEQLRQNRDKNMSEKQLEMIRIIHDSGSDLLHLINDILDLSKIESGSVTLDIEDVPASELIAHVQRTFGHLAEAKGLAFKVDFAADLPQHLRTDVLRLKQVLKNLLSNAIKFTSRGSVTLSAWVARSGWGPERQILNRAPLVVAFSVADTGIGIPASKQKLIFEAFQQADAGTSRRYGGTGLGLAISREIAYLLGGELQVESEEGSGSRFTFYLPQQLLDEGPATKPKLLVRTPIRDDRATISPQDTLLLIIEDDPVFAGSLQAMALERGFKTLVSGRGEDGLELAMKYRPDAITLDLILPDMDGWAVADRLKADHHTRDIPVHVISIRDRPAANSQHGIASYTPKPSDVDALAQVFAKITHHIPRPIRALLVVEHDPEKRKAIMNALQREDVEMDAVSSAAEALAALHSRSYHGIVLDFDLTDMDGIALLQEIRRDPPLAAIPAVIYTARAVDAEAQALLGKLNAAVVAESDLAFERLRMEAEQFLLQVKNDLPEEKRITVENNVSGRQSLEGRKVLIVDDDVRNLFALTGLLESHGMTVVTAERGQEAIARLDDTLGIDIVLMDIMMPEMDGYETIRQIRSDSRFKELPIIALTAKAMKGDREKCLQAGASDYASKPVDSEQLLSQLRAWVEK